MSAPEQHESTNTPATDKLVVYSNSAAFQFTPQKTKAGFHTLGIEAALKGEGSEYDWPNKLTFQLTDRELPPFIAVLMGLLTVATWKNRGKEQKKLQIKHQGVNLFLNVGAGVEQKRYVQAPIESFDAFHVAALGMDQLGKNYPGLTSDSVLVLLKSIIVNIGLKKIERWKESKADQQNEP